MGVSADPYLGLGSPAVLRVFAEWSRQRAMKDTKMLRGLLIIEERERLTNPALAKAAQRLHDSLYVAHVAPWTRAAKFANETGAALQRRQGGA